MDRNPIESLMGEAMDKLHRMIDVNTIVGEPITTPDGTTVIPISKVALGFGSGGSQFCAQPSDKKANDPMFGGGVGGGVSINPVAFLIVNSEQIKLLPVKSSSTTTDKLIDLVPELIGKFNKIANDFIDKKKSSKAEDNDTPSDDDVIIL